MNIITQFDPSSATSGTFNMVFPGNQGKMLVYNESNISLKLTFSNSYTTYVPAWTAMLYCINGLPSPVVTWSQYSVLTSGGAPISQVVIEGFDPNESVPGTYPAALVRQANIGNSLNVSTSTTSIVNDNNAPATAIIESTPNDAASSTWKADNSGNLTVKGDNAGTLTTLIQLIAGASPAVQLAAAAILTTVLGNLRVNGTSTLDNGNIITDGSGNILFAGKLGVSSAGNVLDASGSVDTYLKTRNAGGNINFQVPNGTTIASVGSGGITLQSGNHIQWGSGDTLGATHMVTVNYTAGGAGQAFNHGLSGTPFMVLPVYNGAGSATVGVTNITSTQFTLTAGANASYKCLCLIG